MLIAFTMIVLPCLAAVIAHFWHELSSRAEDYSRDWFLQWAGRGVLTPVLVWVVMNIGTQPLMPPLTQGVADDRQSGLWLAALATQTSLATLVIASCWAALTCGWFMAVLFRRARNGDDLFLTAVFWSPLALPVFWMFTHLAGWSVSGFAALFWLCPITQYLLTEAQIVKPSPTYSRAIANIKFGKYGEAEMAIIGQLEKSETDFDGWMMLADLYAHHFNDLTQAEQTILAVCEEPATTMPQISMALHRLADWQLNLRGDPDAARRVLEEICKRMPGTHLAMMARHRINQLPGSGAELEASQKARTFRMPEPDVPVESGGNPDLAGMSRDEAAAAANELVEQLHANPKDIAAREKLARIFEGPLGKLDLALGQLDLLAGMPNLPPGKAADWLALMVAWEIKHRGENEAVLKILERLVSEHPQTARAFAAQKQLNLLRAHLKIKKA